MQQNEQKKDGNEIHSLSSYEESMKKIMMFVVVQRLYERPINDKNRSFDNARTSELLLLTTDKPSLSFPFNIFPLTTTPEFVVIASLRVVDHIDESFVCETPPLPPLPFV